MAAANGGVEHARAENGRRRWVAIGRSDAADARAAGAEAAKAAVTADDTKLLIVFCSDDYDLEQLLAGIEECAPGVPLIGCSTAGEIATDGPGDAGVVVLALGGAGFSRRDGRRRAARRRGLREAGADGRRAARPTIADARRTALLLLLTDGLAGDQQEIVRGAYAVVGAAVPLVGGCAGDDLQMAATFQFHGGARAAATRSSPRRSAPTRRSASASATAGAASASRCSSPRSAGNRVYTLDDRPALDVYLERLDAPAEARTDPAAFTRFALTHPLGLDRRSGEEQVRFVAGADFEDRSLGCIAEVPQGGLAWFMEGDAESVLDATDAACADALAALGGSAAAGLLAFDCIARRGVLGDEGIAHEVERIAAHAGGAPVAGFYTYGEIARTRGIERLPQPDARRAGGRADASARATAGRPSS